MALDETGILSSFGLISFGTAGVSFRGSFTSVGALPSWKEVSEYRNN